MWGIIEPRVCLAAATGVPGFVTAVVRRLRVLDLDHSAVADIEAIAVPSASSLGDAVCVALLTFLERN